MQTIKYSAVHTVTSKGNPVQHVSVSELKKVLTSPQFETEHPVYFSAIFCKYQKDLSALLKTDARH